ncbi:MAG: aspartate aminotransferase family protein [Ruminococcaceae bacterium]|nr:aspartate aminotransferase family protein [Oscillospiraceae bacterium]
MNIKEKDQKYIMPTYGRLDVALVEGKGSTLKDSEGKEYIDFGSGIAVNTFGACDEEWVKAVTAQLNAIQHTSNYYYTKPCSDLAELLCEKTGMSKVFFSNSGAEANECAIKAARKYGTDKNPEKNIIITLKNSFHGRTVTTLSATGQDVFHKHFTPFTEGFVYAEANNIESLKALASPSCCAIMFECIQGEGGVLPLTQEFVEAAKKIADENDMLIVIDEVQTGNGRTGKLYAHEHYDIKPDIFSTAKGLAGGLPIGATLFSEKVKDVLPAGSHGSTFGGNPIAAAGAVNVLSRLDNDFLNTVEENSAYLWSKLREIKGVKSICGKGYMIGIETETDAKEILKKCLENGLLVLTAKDKVRLLPPLNITKNELDKGISIFKSVMESL